MNPLEHRTTGSTAWAPIYSFLLPGRDVAPQARRMGELRYHAGGPPGDHHPRWHQDHRPQEIPGITGGALDSHEGEPGPFYIQGDHTGGMKYRNITISVPKSGSSK